MIDSNVHITEDGNWFNSPNIDSSVGVLLKKMDEAGVDQAILVPIHGYISNEFVIKTCERYNVHYKRFIPAISLNPIILLKPFLIKQNLLLWQETHNVKIVKLHNRIGNFDPTCREVLIFLEQNDRLESPMIIYFCGYFYNSSINVTANPVDTFIRFANLFRRTKFVIMHCGGSWCLHLYDALRDNENFYFDLSHVISKYKQTSVGIDLGFLIRNFDRRLIWGSDFPEYTPERSLSDLKDLMNTVEIEKQNNILGQTLLRLLNDTKP